MILSKNAVSGNMYRVAHTYVDRRNPHLDGDEFSAWLHPSGKPIFPRLG